MTTEITGSALTEEKTLTVVIGRAKTPVTSLAAASAAYRAYIDDNDYGARDAALCHVLDATGTKVARISYNGRVWLPD